MEPRSIQVHKNYSDAREKFDYFILALIVAVLAYLGKDVRFEEIGSNISTIYLIALFVFAVAAVSGFKRIEYSIEFHRLNHLSLDALEKGNDKGADSADVQVKKVADRCLIFYQIRNICFLLGFVCFIVAKILAAYIST